MVSDDDIVQVVFGLLKARDPSASICPSEAARALAAGETPWRALMPRVRDVARRLAGEGRLAITQREATLLPDAPWRGAVRLRLPPGGRGAAPALRRGRAAVSRPAVRRP